ncbi:hypothetical protein TIFTF001_022572 [Ficus carica]|uniref:Uncharacterized protein n=1 Tax=Ficus carica TaxID=3494 RepID=A0AA88DCY3_FICCA|nr:hypothetical protein TIFTF001_022572 [Ficus carica]
MVPAATPNEIGLAPVPVSYGDHPPASAIYHITNNLHLPWQDLPSETTIPLSLTLTGTVAPLPVTPIASCYSLHNA